MIAVVMGVSGSGKTTVGRLLAGALGWPFYDADDHHPPANVEKMARGEPLTDRDRAPWLERLHELVAGCIARREDAVLACSALRDAHRDVLSGGSPEVRFVYLRGDAEILRARLAARRGHFFDPGLLDSQLRTLEEPERAVVVDVREPPEQLVEQIARALAGRSGA